MALDLSALRDSLVALDKSRGYLDSDLGRNDAGLREQFRAACIQAFEFTYEVGFKMLRRRLELMSENPTAVDHMSFMQLIRTAAEAGLISDIDRFRDYRHKRNITSHTYNQEKAEEIVAVLRDFSADMHALLAELERRNRDEAD